MSGVIFNCFSASFLQTGFLCSLKLIDAARLAGQQSLKICLAPAPVLALQVAGIKVKASYVQDLLRPPTPKKVFVY